MPGGVMQLVIYGAQDIYITGNPQITFFKVVYRRHTNFAYEAIKQTFQAFDPDFGKTNNLAIISRTGDLVHQLYLEVITPSITVYDINNNVVTDATWTYGLGNAMIQQTWLQIGGQTIDTHYAEWLNIWTELTTPPGLRSGYDDIIGNAVSSLDGSYSQTSLLSCSKQHRIYIPFQFWFNRNPGLALPLIALQYHDVRLWINIQPISSLINSISGVSYVQTGANSQFTLWVNYIFLDVDERRRFAQVSHEYLIEQIQFTGDQIIPQSATTIGLDQSFNQPVKALYWVFVDNVHATAGNYITGNRWLHFGQYMNGGHSVNAPDTNDIDEYQVNNDMFGLCKIQFNGQDRFYERPADYFRKIQMLEHHTNVPRTPLIPGCTSGIMRAGFRQFIYMYSFAITPEEHQPSGTCNFSRIEHSTLWFNFIDPITGNNLVLHNNYSLKVFAYNYNVLRIMSGMGGLAYSN